MECGELENGYVGNDLRGMRFFRAGSLQQALPYGQ